MINYWLGVKGVTAMINTFVYIERVAQAVMYTWE